MVKWQVVFAKHALKDAKKLSAAGLREKAQELLDATTLDLADLRTLVESLRTHPALSPVPRRPPSRSNSANLSQETCKSRSNPAK